VKYSFHTRTSLAAEIAIGSDQAKRAILTDAVKAAEKLDLERQDRAMFTVDPYGVKVIVEMQKRSIHIVTVDETKQLGLDEAFEAGRRQY
jgi:transketolase C-terminal domain/subunit